MTHYLVTLEDSGNGEFIEVGRHSVARADRLTRLRMLANIHVYRAEPGSRARRVRQARLERIAAAHRAEVAA